MDTEGLLAKGQKAITNGDAAEFAKLTEEILKNELKESKEHRIKNCFYTNNEQGPMGGYKAIQGRTQASTISTARASRKSC